MIPQGPFALIKRADRAEVEIFSGDVVSVPTLADIPVPSGVGPLTLAVVPYRQVAERGLACVDDGAPLSCLRIGAVSAAPLAAVLDVLPDEVPALRGGAFDISDADYAGLVGQVLDEEIGRGEGSNFVIHRVFEAAVDGDPLRAALAAFARLLRHERGAYWTFCVHTGARTLVGATPERHVSVDDGLVMMNPISGTFRHEPGAPPTEAALLQFLADPKEMDELYMVLDEELKMMATVAEGGGQVIGPYLKPMAHLHHTEYLLAGRTALDVRDVLRETMFAPTVVGSPLENACRVVARHERRGRGYYGGVLALIGRDATGRQTLDAPILIRTAEITPDGAVRVPVGATLVRHSTAAAEVAETRTKAAGVLAALTTDALRDLGDSGHDFEPQNSKIAESSAVLAALAARNRHLARFWLDQRGAGTGAGTGARVLIIDAEDTFTGMLAHQLRALGLRVERAGYRAAATLDLDGYDLVVAGPGPGDPTHRGDQRMDALRTLARLRLATGRPLLGVCLGHQLIAGLLGLPLHRKDGTYQGTQREISFFGRPERVGFYSTFLAIDAGSTVDPAIEISRDPVTREVYAMRGPGFVSVQFHPESVLTEHGVDLLRDLLVHLEVLDPLTTVR